MNDNDIIKALECCCIDRDCSGCCYEGEKTAKCVDDIMHDALDLINRQKAEIDRLKSKVNRLKQYDEARDIRLHARLTDTARAEAIKEFTERIGKLLGRYAHIHKYADKARHSTEEYLDGTPMEMVSVWEVLSLKKWEMVEYETMNQLQENIETIAKERLLSELEKDFRLLVKEMTEGQNENKP